MDSLENYYESTLEDLQKIIKTVANREVLNIIPQNTICKDTFPCKGHGGIIIVYKNGTSENISCSSITSGGIMWYYNVDNDHFRSYINGEFRQYLIDHLRKL